MWAPADLFSPALNAVSLTLTRIVSYFYEHLIVLSLVLVAVAALLTAATVAGNRRAGRS